MIGSYEIVYLISNALGVYSIYLFMCVFYSEKKTTVKKDLFLFGMFYMLNVSIYIFVKIPIVIMSYNLIGMFLLAMTREKRIKKALLSTVYIYVILVLVEVLVVLGTHFVRMPITEKYDYSVILGTVSVNVINYAVVLVIRNFIKARKGMEIPTSYWVALVAMPAGSLYVLIGIIGSKELSTIQIATTTIVVLMMNFSTFFLYDVMGKYYEAKVNEKAMIQLNRSYIRQFDIINESNEKVRSFRHDMKKHLAVLDSLLASGNHEKAGTYMQNMKEQMNHNIQIANSGNLVIDSIVNYELDKALNHNVTIEFESEILPRDLMVTDFDMTIVLSNLVSNAVQAQMALGEEEERFIGMTLKYSKGMFYIWIKNSFNGTVIYKDNALQTVKKDKRNHGLGIGILRRTLEKYDGELKINHNENFFIAEAFMYV